MWPAANANTAAVRRPGPGQGAGPRGNPGGPAGARLVPLFCVAWRCRSFVYTRLMSPSVGLRGLLLLPLAALIFASGCQSTGKHDKQRISRYTPEVLYDRGQKELKSGNYKEAVQDFEALT